MRIKSRWLVILLVLGMIVAACGDGEAEDTTTTAGDDVTTTQGDMTTTTEGDMTDTTMGDDMDIATDVGVDLEAGTIHVGLLSDLSGVFAGLVTPIATAHEVYWENNDVHGLQVIPVIEDTGYVQDTHVQKYNEIKDEVVMFGHSTGSPQTVAIREDLEENDILAIPLTWYSGWTDPSLNSSLIQHGSPYCIESQNVIQWVHENVQELSTMAIATLPGDYGLDGAAGAELAAEALGIEIVLDLRGQITDAASIASAGDQIAEENPDIVWITTFGAATSGVIGQALAGGYSGLWGAQGPSFSPDLIAADSALKDAVANTMYFGFYLEGWSGDSQGTQDAIDLLLGSGRDITPYDYYLEGILEAQMVHRILEIAYENGDMTRAGVLAAAKSIESLDFNGLGPSETYVGTPNEQLQRQTWVMRPDPEGLASGENGGSMIVGDAYTGSIVENFDFQGACYVLGS